MGVKTRISWCDHTWNAWTGCTKVSPGCLYCYAEAGSLRNPAVLGRWGRHGSRVMAAASGWRKPPVWDRAAARDGVRRRVFANSVSDVFEDWDGPLGSWNGANWWRYRYQSEVHNTPIPPEDADRVELVTMDDARDRLFGLISETPNLDWLLLTKRPERWKWCWPMVSVPGHVRQNEGDGLDWKKFPNLWMGVSVEDRKHGLPRIDVLRSIPAAVRYLSVEPLLEDLGPLDLSGIDWVIVGGESGWRSQARPLNPDWVRSLRDQCLNAGVAFFFKQWGAWAPAGSRGSYCFNPGASIHDLVTMDYVGTKAAGCVLDGREWHQFPGRKVV